MHAKPTALVVRVPVHFRVGGRLYPSIWRDQEQPTPEPFITLARHILDGLPLKPGQTKSEMFASYAKGVGSLTLLRKETDDYLKKVSAAAMLTQVEYECPICRSRTSAAPNRRKGAHPSDMLWRCSACQSRSHKETWQTHRAGDVPEKTFSLPTQRPPKAFGIELAAQEPRAVYDAMIQALVLETEGYVHDLLDACDRMVDAKHAGLIAWGGKGLCRYHYYTYVDQTIQTDLRSKTTKDSQKVDGGTQQTTRKETERDLLRTVTLRFHLHDLLDARRVPLAKAAPPPRVRPLFQDPPKQLAPFLEVIEGTQIRELTFEMEVRREKRTEKTADEQTRLIPDPQPRFNPDPALVLGDTFVLAGWLPEE